jgi:2-amino-4-hydroxy-6-hydroxymethyldihydropteridine diphosphokinase
MIVIALGANLPSPAGLPPATLSAGLSALARHGISVASVSSYYRTPAWPDPNDPPFVNAAAVVETAMTPEDAMQTLHAVEAEFGRTRGRRNAPRTLDLDLIDYEGMLRNGPLVLPHPRMTERAFVLVPLAEIAPLWRHPADGRSVSELIAALPAAMLTSIERLERRGKTE